MKLTGSQLKQIIKEEIDSFVEEFDPAAAIEEIEVVAGMKFTNAADVAYLMTSKTQEEFDEKVEEMWEPPE